MYKQLSTITNLSYEEIFEEDMENEYLNLQGSIKNLMVYVNSKDFNEGVSSQLEPYVRDLKGILVKLHHTIFNNQSEFSRYAIKDIFKKKTDYIYIPKNLARELQFKFLLIVEMVNEVVKLFSEGFKITYRIQEVYSISQKLISIMIKKAPKSAGAALKKFTQGRGKVTSLVTPFYIAKEAMFISKNNLYNISKELEYAKADGNRPAIEAINNKIEKAEEEKSQLDCIKAVVHKISEEYRVLISDIQKIGETIEEKILLISNEIDKIDKVIDKNKNFQRRINVLI